MLRHLAALLLAWCLALGPGCAPPVSAQQVMISPPAVPAGAPLGILKGANFNSTADQSINIPPSVTAFQITAIVVTNCSTSLTLAAGGFYPTTAKGGTPIVAAAQIYSSLTGTSVLLSTTVAATPLVTRYTISTVYLSLTTAQGGAATCDVFLYGNNLS